MTSLDIIGTFSIMGSNQDANENWYKGKLDLSLDHNNRIIAKWTINGSQEQFGTGFFKNNILVIQFNYKDIQNVFPELVSQDDDEMLAVNYQGLIPILINALKEQDAKISRLEQLTKQLITNE